MIVIDENNEAVEYLKSFCEERVGIVRLDATTFELANGLETEVVVISAKSYAELSSKSIEKLKKSFSVLIFNEADSDLGELPSNVISVFNRETRTDTIINQIIFSENLSKEHLILKSQFFTLNRELSEVMGGVESELLRVKKAYELKTPRRLEEFKAFKVFSKYAAGENMGGEFFDIFTNENKIFFMMSSTSSYLLSSSILHEFTQLKEKSVITSEDEKIFMSNIKNELDVLNKSKKKEVEVDLLTCILDTNTLLLQGHSFGHFNILSSQMKNSCGLSNMINDDFDKMGFEMQLSRGERILINSPGFLKSWDATSPKFMIEELIINSKVKAIDVLDEIFFQIKKESLNGFLSNDASSIMLEVQKNAMVQI